MDAAEELNVRYFILGSVAHRAQTLYAHARVYAMHEGTYQGTISADLSADRMDELAKQIAMRIGQIVRQSAAKREEYANFRWAQKFRFSFGTDRYDLEPPVVYFVNGHPPFEISVKVNMERTGGMVFVSHFEVYADDEPIAIVLADREAPRPLRERKIQIDGHPFCFQATVKELRGRAGSSISTAVIDLIARSCADN